jgi:hypothetical protein
LLFESFTATKAPLRLDLPSPRPCAAARAAVAAPRPIKAAFASLALLISGEDLLLREESESLPDLRDLRSLPRARAESCEDEEPLLKLKKPPLDFFSFRELRRLGGGDVKNPPKIPVSCSFSRDLRDLRDCDLAFADDAEVGLLDRLRRPILCEEP